MKDYYVVLGIARDASQSGIRSAYRQRARERHPDVAGHAATGEFQELTEAYQVLSDPRRRAVYDQRLRRQHFEGGRGHVRNDSRARPLRQEWWGAGDVVQVEVTISRGDAVRGGTLRLDVPWLGLVGVSVPPMTGDGTVLQAQLAWGASTLLIVLRVWDW